MSDFLNFLNTAELETLTKVSGVTRLIAGNIIAARPFDAVDDCLNVRGMGKNLLTRIQTAFDAGELKEENRAMVTAPEESMSIEKSRFAQEKEEDVKPSFLSRLGRAFVNFMLALLRLILTLAFIAIIGAALYFGVPFFNEKLIVPMEKNTAGIINLESQVADLQSQLDALNVRVGVIEKSIESQSASIAKLEEMQNALEKEITTQNNSVMVALKREIMFTRAIETLSRSRLYLSQSNFGLAKVDVKSARELLAALKADAPEYQQPALDSTLARLDLALGNLPAFPVIAADDVDIAWELMMMGLPESAADVTATPALTFTPTPILEVTPTATP